VLLGEDGREGELGGVGPRHPLVHCRHHPTGRRARATDRLSTSSGKEAKRHTPASSPLGSEMQSDSNTEKRFENHL
jgi:hypothetical protein